MGVFESKKALSFPTPSAYVWISSVVVESIGCKNETWDTVLLILEPYLFCNARYFHMPHMIFRLVFDKIIGVNPRKSLSEFARLNLHALLPNLRNPRVSDISVLSPLTKDRVQLPFEQSPIGTRASSNRPSVPIRLLDLSGI